MLSSTYYNHKFKRPIWNHLVVVITLDPAQIDHIKCFQKFGNKYEDQYRFKNEARCSFLHKNIIYIF